MGLVTHWFFNASLGETLADSRERMLLAGGYGGWLAYGPYSSRYDGFYCRADTWETYDGYNWTLINNNNTFQGRAWFAMTVMHGTTPNLSYVPHNPPQPARIYLFGGGYVGSVLGSKKKVTKMAGKADAFYSIDGITWVQINYQEGGGSTTVPFYSSELWSKTIVDTNTVYIGKWGLTALSFNRTTKKPVNIFLNLSL